MVIKNTRISAINVECLRHRSGRPVGRVGSGRVKNNILNAFVNFAVFVVFLIEVVMQNRRRNRGGNGGARPRNTETAGAKVSLRLAIICPTS